MYKDIVQDIILDLELSINNELSLTPQDYCQLDLYTPKKKPVQTSDYDNQDCYFLIVDQASFLTLGTISCNTDDNDNKWITVSAVKNQNNTPQELYFDQFLSNVVKNSTSSCIVNFNDQYIQFSNSLNVFKKIKIVVPKYFFDHLVPIVILTPTYWLSVNTYGLSSISLVPAIASFLLILAIYFTNDDY